MDYLGKHVFLTDERKLIFSRVFNRYCNESSNGARRIFPDDVLTALQEIMGTPLNLKHETFLESIVGNISENLDFRKWCGMCAVAERLLSSLPPKQLDPPTWIEKADFEGLEQRLNLISVDSRLACLLHLIRDC